MDRTKLGLVLAKDFPRIACRRFPRATDVQDSTGDPELPAWMLHSKWERGDIGSLHPHMHTRGKDFEYRLVFPGGETRTILKVPPTTGTGSSGTTWPSPSCSQGNQDRVHRPFRQFAEQSGEPGPNQDRDLGTAKLGRDDGGIF